MATLGVDLGLGGIFRQALIDEAHVVSAWDLRQMVLEPADFVFGMNPGTWTSAGGVARAVTMDIPEGALGATFDGTGYVLVPHDGDGFLRPGDATERTLSLRDGAMDIVCLIKTTTNDGTLRAIVQKQETNSGGNGWHVALQNGRIIFKLVVATSTIFNITSAGSVHDGAVHLVHCCYNPAAGEVRILIDGVQSGATVTGVTTEPDTNTGNLRIGMFNDGAGGLTATLAYVMVGRNGNHALSTTLQATRAWTDVTAHVREVVEIQGGTPGLSLDDVQDGIGTVSFVLHNAPLISGTITPGYYTIGHANQRAGLDLGIPVRVRLTSGGTTQYFRYRLAAADPEADTVGGRRVFCLAEDWFATLARAPATSLPIRTAIRSDIAWCAIVDSADYPPVAVVKAAGDETFPFCFDRVSGTLLSEMTAVTFSEGGHSHIRPDTVTGGVVTFNPASTRPGDTSVDFTFDNTMSGLRAEIAERHVINTVRYTITPRRAGGSVVVLYSQTQRQPIAAGDRAVFEGSYQDDSQSRSAIGGTDIQAFTPSTDYTLNGNEGGTGGDATSDIRVDLFEAGGSGFRIEVTNTGASTGWFAFQIRGEQLFTDVPLTEVVEDSDSVRRRGLHGRDVSYPYLNSAVSARARAQMEIGLFADPTRIPQDLEVWPVPGSAKELSTIRVAPGDLIAVGEPMSAISTATKYWAQNYRLSVSVPGIVRGSFGLFAA